MCQQNNSKTFLETNSEWKCFSLHSKLWYKLTSKFISLIFWPTCPKNAYGNLYVLHVIYWRKVVKTGYLGGTLINAIKRITNNPCSNCKKIFFEYYFSIKSKSIQDIFSIWPLPDRWAIHRWSRIRQARRKKSSNKVFIEEYEKKNSDQMSITTRFTIFLYRFYM